MIRVVVKVRELACPLCGALVAHAPNGRAWLAQPHDAPCGRPCACGGVPVEVFMLGPVHRDDDCEECVRAVQ